MSPLAYREAARRVRRSVRTINRWRKAGMHMTWENQNQYGQGVRVVEEDVLLAHWRDRLDANPAHQWRLRRTLATHRGQSAAIATGDGGREPRAKAASPPAELPRRS